MTVLIGYYLSAWAFGYCLGFKVRQIRSALAAA